METIIAALVTGAFAFIGVVVTNISANRRMQSASEKSQAVTDAKLEDLTREVREHNNFARRMPVVEDQLKRMDRRLENLEEYHKQPKGE